jgi:hypothetical protein
MMLIAFLVLAAVAVVALAVVLAGGHFRRRRRSGRRTQRADDYADRAVQWRSYLRLHSGRGTRRLTDQRSTLD